MGWDNQGIIIMIDYEQGGWQWGIYQNISSESDGYFIINQKVGNNYTHPYFISISCINLQQQSLFMQQFAQFVAKSNHLSTVIADRRQEISLAKLPSNSTFTVLKSSKDSISCRLPLDRSDHTYCRDLSKKLGRKGVNAHFARMIPPGTINPFINVTFIEYGGNPYDLKYIQHQNGQIVLILFGSDDVMSLMDYMEKKMIKNEAKWGDAVRMIFISSVNYGWQKFDKLELVCYCSSNFFESKLEIQSNFVCLIDKFGKVDYSMGDDFQFGYFDFQARINQLLAQLEEEPQIVPQQNPIIKPDTTILQVLTTNYLESIFQDTDFLCIQAKLSSKLDRGNYSQHAEVQAYIYEEDDDSYITLRQVFEDLKETQLTINKIKRVKVPQPNEPKCQGCKKALSYPYYWLYWQNSEKFACLNCVQKPSSKPEKHFSYRKNSILLSGKWDSILLNDLGDNLQPQDINQSRHKFTCNLCDYSSHVGQARYICLGCRVFSSFTQERLDICQDCHAKDISKELNEKIAGLKHHEGHPLLRVLYHTYKDKY